MFFSVVIPTYNRRHQIVSAIDSALAQAEDAAVSLEVVVVDDHSTDETVAFLRSNYAGCPVRVLLNDRTKGPAGARNCGMLAAGGEAIAFLDSDDAFLPGHLSACSKLFSDNPEVGVVFGPALYECDGEEVEYMGPNFERKLAHAPVHSDTGCAKIFTDAYFTHLLEYGCYFNLSSVVVRTGHEEKPLMNESLRIAEDYEFWVRLSRTRTYACLNENQIRYTLHADNISFESEKTAADHAPMLLKAYRIMAAYPELKKSEQQIVRRHMSQVHFDWAYRSRTHRQFGGAFLQHFQSMKYGLFRQNLIAMTKLPFVMLLSMLRMPDQGPPRDSR